MYPTHLPCRYQGRTLLTPSCKVSVVVRPQRKAPGVPELGGSEPLPGAFLVGVCGSSDTEGGVARTWLQGRQSQDLNGCPHARFLPVGFTVPHDSGAVPERCQNRGRPPYHHIKERVKCESH